MLDDPQPGRGAGSEEPQAPPAPVPPAARAPSDAAAADLDPADRALVSAVADDEHAPHDLASLAEATGAGHPLLEALERAGLLLPHHHDADGIARFSEADVEAVRAGLRLLEAGLPLGELLDLARRTDAAVGEIAAQAVEAFLRFVRDPVRGTATSEDEAAARLVTAYQRMLPATEQLVAHHLRRRLLATAGARVAEELGEQEPGDQEPGDEGSGP